MKNITVHHKKEWLEKRREKNDRQKKKVFYSP